jgi:hypothetical protein
MSNSYVHPVNFISNLDKRDKYALIRAANSTNTKIYFEEKAYDGKGMPLKDIIGVFSGDTTQNYSSMWSEYNNILREARNAKRNAIRQ